MGDFLLNYYFLFLLTKLHSLQDQVHVVKQGVLGLYIDNNGGHKIKKPKVQLLLTISLMFNPPNISVLCFSSG